MQETETIKTLIMDSLIARSGKSLTSELIRDITSELTERINESIYKLNAQLSEFKAGFGILKTEEPSHVD